MSGNLSVSSSIPADISHTTVEEARQGLGAEGQPAPEGTVPVMIEDGDYISLVMQRMGLDWTDDAERVQFLMDNPQFITADALAQHPELAPYAEQAGGRDPDLVFPGEVIYIRVDEGGDQTADARPTQEEAAATTDEAAQAVEDARNAEYPPGLEFERDSAVQQAHQDYFDAVEAEVDAGLTEFLAGNPDATPQEIQAEADRLRHQIQGRTGFSASVDDASMEFRTQQAVNSATARQHGVELDDYAPGAVANDGPYTETAGPFEPDSSVQLANGSYVRTDANGWPQTDADGDGVADPATPEEAAEATNEAAADLDDARSADWPPGLEGEQQNAISDATTRAGNAIQHEIELGLQQYIAQNPDASEADIEREADRLMHGILGREEVGGIISESQAEFRRDQALEFVTTGE